MKKGVQTRAEPEADVPEAVLLSATPASRLINFLLITSGRDKYLSLLLPACDLSFSCVTSY